MGKKSGKQIDPQKNWHLEWDGKNGKQIDEKKGWHLEWDGKNGKQRTPRKNGHLTKMDWEKKWEAHRSKKKVAS